MDTFRHVFPSGRNLMRSLGHRVHWHLCEKIRWNLMGQAGYDRIGKSIVFSQKLCSSNLCLLSQTLRVMTAQHALTSMTSVRQGAIGFGSLPDYLATLQSAYGPQMQAELAAQAGVTGGYNQLGWIRWRSMVGGLPSWEISSTGRTRLGISTRCGHAAGVAAEWWVGYRKAAGYSG